MLLTFIKDIWTSLMRRVFIIPKKKFYFWNGMIQKIVAWKEFRNNSWSNGNCRISRLRFVNWKNFQFKKQKLEIFWLKFPCYFTSPLLVSFSYSCTQFVCYLNMHGTKNLNGNFEHLFSLNEINIKSNLKITGEKIVMCKKILKIT